MPEVLVFCQTGVTVNTGTAGTYTFTMPAHPNGSNYMVFVQQQITTLSTAIAIYMEHMLLALHLLQYLARQPQMLQWVFIFYVYIVP